MAAKEIGESDPPSVTVRASGLKPAANSVGQPRREAQYLECKALLKAELFTSRKSFFEYAKLAERVARENGVLFRKFETAPPPRLREVIFLDTAKFHLYNNAFILRRRVRYEDGFPAGDPEVVLKFRHPDALTALETDVRPRGVEKYDVKFKAEALPLKDRLGGYRLLYSHNVQFGVSQAPPGAELIEIFPCLATVLKSGVRGVDLVNHTIVEEVLQDLGTLDFGGGMAAKCNIAIWRERGWHRPLIGEFAFQVKFKNRDEVRRQPFDRVMGFFIGLQDLAADWALLGTTKTGVVYQLRGNPPQGYE